MPVQEKIKEQNYAVENRYRLCPACGNFSHINEKQEFCIACGERLIQECPNCKEAIIYPTAKFCFKCGEKYIIELKQGNEFVS